MRKCWTFFFFFLIIPFFLSFGVDFAGQGCIFTHFFQSYWNNVLLLEGMEGDALFWDFSCFFLGVDVIPCSSSSLVSCDSATQSSSGILVF